VLSIFFIPKKVKVIMTEYDTILNEALKNICE
jgi:hypothetical protein